MDYNESTLFSSSTPNDDFLNFLNIEKTQQDSSSSTLTTETLEKSPRICYNLVKIGPKIHQINLLHQTFSIPKCSAPDLKPKNTMYLTDLFQKSAEKKKIKGNILLKKDYKYLKLVFYKGKEFPESILFVFGVNDKESERYRISGPFVLKNENTFYYELPLLDKNEKMKNGKAFHLEFQVVDRQLREAFNEKTPLIYAYEKQKFDTMSKFDPITWGTSGIFKY